MEKTNSLGAVVLLLLLFFGIFAVDAHAVSLPEPSKDPDPSPTSEPAATPDVSAKLDSMLDSLNTIVDLLTPAEDEPETTPAPDYTEQFSQIETTLSSIESTVIQSTVETAEPPVFEKPFEDYTTTETLLLVLSAFALLAFFLYFVSKFF